MWRKSAKIPRFRGILNEAAGAGSVAGQYNQRLCVRYIIAISGPVAVGKSALADNVVAA